MPLKKRFNRLGLAVAILATTANSAVAWVNPGFETGTTAGWTVSLNSGPAVFNSPSSTAVPAIGAPYTNGLLSQAHTGSFGGGIFSGNGDPNHGDSASIRQSDMVPAGSTCLSAYFAASLNGYHFNLGEAYGSDSYVIFQVVVAGVTVYSKRFSWYDNAGTLLSPGPPYNAGNYISSDGVHGPWKYLPWQQSYFDMSAYVGQTATIIYTAYSCDQVEHYCFGYIDDVAWSVCPPTPTPSPTATPTPTRTVTPSSTPSFSASPSFTCTPSATPSWTASPSATSSATLSATVTPSSTPSATATGTFTSSSTATSTMTPTSTLTVTATGTVTPSATATATPSWTFTASPTFTASATASPSSTASPTFSDTATASPSFTQTSTSTVTPTDSPSATDTATATASQTSTASPSFTNTPTDTVTSSQTPTSTITPTSSATPTVTDTLTQTCTFTISPTPTQTRTAVPGVLVNFTVYNSAGEVVQVLPPIALYGSPTSATLGSAAFSPDLGQVAQLDFSGESAKATWDGHNSNGQIVSGGIYTLQAVYTDNFGKVTTIAVTAQVLRAPTGIVIDVYNSAGERVRRLTSAVDPGMLSQPELSSNVLVPPRDPALGNSGLKIGLGSAPPVWWNGRNDAGRVVTSGTYLVKVTFKLNGSAVTYAQSVSVLSPNVDDPLSTAWCGPNPASASQSVMVIGLEVGINASGLRGRIYNLAGELVTSLTPAADGHLYWQLGSRASAGIYLLELEIVDVTGRQRRRTLKLALVP